MEKEEYGKAVIYCRVSSEKQVKEGNGLDSQEHRCREYARSLGLEVENVFRDEGISGGLFDRPAMKSLIEYLDIHWQTKYFVIFDDLKRFARDVEVHIKLKSELKAREAKLRCLNYNFDESAEGEFVETIFAAQNQLERKQNRRQVCQKMKARIERGYWCFNPPIGYEYTKDKEHGKLLTPKQPMADIVAEGLNAFADNRLKNQIDLFEFFKSKNLCGLVGKKELYLQMIRGLLSQPLYAGFIEYSKWGISRRRGHHKALITEETYKIIQEKIKRPERIPHETDNLEFPLRRIINCSVCGKKMTGSSNKGRWGKYYAHYTCNNKSCSANPKNIQTTKVEEDYVKLLESIKVNPELLEMTKEVATRIWQKKIKVLSADHATKDEEVKNIEKQIDDYINLIPFTKSDSVKERYEQKVEALDKMVRELKSDAKNKKEPNLDEALNLSLKFLGTPAETWKKADRKLKSMVHDMIFEENPEYCAETGFGIPKLSIPFCIKYYIVDEKSDLVDPTGFEPATSSMPWRRSTN